MTKQLYRRAKHVAGMQCVLVAVTLATVGVPAVIEYPGIITYTLFSIACLCWCAQVVCWWMVRLYVKKMDR